MAQDRPAACPDAGRPKRRDDDRAARARRAVATIFAAHGLVIGSWAPHVPTAKAETGVDTDELGLILLCMALGAVAAMAFAGAAIARFGSARVTIVATIAFCLAFLAPVMAATPIGLAAGLLVFGMAAGLMDVAMNAHAVDVEAALERPVMSSFHGWFSLGAMLGAGGGGWLLEQTTPEIHAIAVALSVLALATPRFRALLPPRTDATAVARRFFAIPTGPSLLLGALCLIAMMTEGAVLDWSALHLTQEIAAPAAAGGLGYALLSAGMAVSRFLGDRVRTVLGDLTTLRSSAIVGATGLVAAVATPYLPVAVAGYVICGFGIGNIVPVLFSIAGRREPDRPGHAIAAVTTLGYSGFVLGPPVVGALAAHVGLTAALVMLAVACAGIARLSPRATG